MRAGRDAVAPSPDHRLSIQRLTCFTLLVLLSSILDRAAGVASLVETVAMRPRRLSVLTDCQQGHAGSRILRMP